MKTVVRRSLTILMCAGTLIAGTQSWAKDVSTSSATKTVKAQEPCTKPCKMEKDENQSISSKSRCRIEKESRGNCPCR